MNALLSNPFKERLRKGEVQIANWSVVKLNDCLYGRNCRHFWL